MHSGTSAYPRAYRVADLLQTELAALIRRDMTDPRIKSVTVIEVKLSDDLAHATVYINVHDEISEKEPAVTALQHAQGFLRRRLADTTSLRIIPTLRFCYDETLTRGRHIDDLLAKIDEQ